MSVAVNVLSKVLQLPLVAAMFAVTEEIAIAKLQASKLSVAVASPRSATVVGSPQSTLASRMILRDHSFPYNQILPDRIPKLTVPYQNICQNIQSSDAIVRHLRKKE